jgi:hypothetical protein
LSGRGNIYPYSWILIGEAEASWNNILSITGPAAVEQKATTVTLEGKLNIASLLTAKYF